MTLLLTARDILGVVSELPTGHKGRAKRSGGGQSHNASLPTLRMNQIRKVPQVTLSRVVQVRALNQLSL